MFDDQFEVALADTQESKNIHYSIRYQVYCEEMGYENCNNFPFKQEFDAYDDHSIHFIVKHKPTEQWVGAMRLIVKTTQLLPIERHCSLTNSINYNDSVHSVELSRLCLIKKIRRKYSNLSTSNDFSKENGETEESCKIRSLQNCRFNRSIIWGMIYAASKYSYQNNIPNWYFMTTSGLEKILRQGGLDMTNIGEPCEYRGIRYPFKMNAFETYQKELWQEEYNNGYFLFSDLNFIEKYKAA